MLKNYAKIKYSLVVILSVFILVSFGVLAVGGEVMAIGLQISIPGIDNKSVSGFPEYVEAIYNLFIGVVGILAVIMIMLGGFQWLLAAGNAQKIAGAKTTIISAIMGLVLALTSYTILEIVNPNIKELSFSSKIGINLKEDEKIRGLCARGMNPILRKDTKPKCGKSYILTEPNKQTGADELCAGFSMDQDKKEGCYREDGQNTQKIEFLSIEDTRPDGFGARNWEFFTINSSIDRTSGKSCGKLYVWKDEKNDYYYRIGRTCSEDRRFEEFCVINGNEAKFGEITKKNFPKEGSENYIEVGELNEHECALWEKE